MILPDEVRRFKESLRLAQSDCKERPVILDVVRVHPDFFASRPDDLIAAEITEKWICGTHVVAGVFLIDAETITVQTFQDSIPGLYALTKAKRRQHWPRGIAGTFLLPFYLGTDFGADETA